MNDKLYIDGYDAFERFGIFVEKDGYNELVALPPLKVPEDYDWPEHDGAELDLSNPQLDTKEINLRFCRVKSAQVDDLVYYLSSTPYHEFYFKDIGYKVTLRLVDQPREDNFHHLGKFTLKFADDFPLASYVYQTPINLNVQQYGYAIDGRLLSDYSIWVLEGTDNEIEKNPAVKKNLTVQTPQTAGSTYFGKRVFYTTKEVQVKCGMHVQDVAIFWQNYKALLYDLIQPEERRFYYDGMAREFPCYYKSSKISRFDITGSGSVWCEFTLTMVFTDFRTEEEIYLMADEDMFFVVSEDGKDYIDVKIYDGQ